MVQWMGSLCRSVSPARPQVHSFPQRPSSSPSPLSLFPSSPPPSPSRHARRSPTCLPGPARPSSSLPRCVHPSSTSLTRCSSVARPNPSRELSPPNVDSSPSVASTVAGLSTSASRAALSKYTFPAMSPTMTEGGIARWNKKDGEAFGPGDVIFEIVSTDRTHPASHPDVSRCWTTGGSKVRWDRASSEPAGKTEPAGGASSTRVRAADEGQPRPHFRQPSSAQHTRLSPCTRLQTQH